MRAADQDRELASSFSIAALRAAERSDDVQNAEVQKGRVDALPVRWRVTTTAGVMFTCRVEIDGPRIEVRLSTGDDLVCMREVATIEAANGVAHAWLRAVVAGGPVEGLRANSRTPTVH